MSLATAAPRRTKSSGARFNGARQHAMHYDARAHNVAQPERIGSVALGAALVTYGIRRRDPAGAIAALLGGAFVLRGATGHCPVYQAMGVSTGNVDAILGPSHSDVTGRAATVNARRAVKVERAVTIAADRKTLFNFWRNFENLPRFMEHLESVRVESPTRSHWVAKAPAGRGGGMGCRDHQRDRRQPHRLEEHGRRRSAECRLRALHRCARRIAARS